MVCHETWAYDDDAHIATLTGFEIHCPDCDAVCHFGRTGQRGYADVALAHLARVNKITLEDAQTQVDAAFDQWRRRSRGKWVIRVAPAILAEWPEVAVLSDGEADTA